MYLRPSKPVAKAFIPYICAMYYIAIPILAVIGVVQHKMLFGIIDLVLILQLVLFNYTFSWYVVAKLEKFKDKLVFTVTEILDVLGHDSTKYTINSIDKYNIKGKNLVVYGDITVKEAVRKEKPVKKVVMYDYTDEVLNTVKEFCS